MRMLVSCAAGEIEKDIRRPAPHQGFGLGEAVGGLEHGSQVVWGDGQNCKVVQRFRFALNRLEFLFRTRPAGQIVQELGFRQSLDVLGVLVLQGVERGLKEIAAG